MPRTPVAHTLSVALDPRLAHTVRLAAVAHRTTVRKLVREALVRELTRMNNEDAAALDAAPNTPGVRP